MSPHLRSASAIWSSVNRLLGTLGLGLLLARRVSKRANGCSLIWTPGDPGKPRQP
jgi:hypothetical protein